MKTPRFSRFRYLSNRILLLLAAYLALIFVLLVYSAAVTVRNGFFWIPVLAGCLLFAAGIYAGYRLVYLPYRETSKVLRLFAGGYTMQGIYDLRYPYSPEIEMAVEKLWELVGTRELISSTKKQAQYLALQNQINPHFLYNTLEGIRGEALMQGLDNIADMTEALATFFRYTISNLENLVTLEDELRNIENYFFIQRYRFGERLSLAVEYDEEDKNVLMHYRLPKLTLQPIVENSIIHGVEHKVGRGNVRIKIETTAKRLIIHVSDDGLGMDEERLSLLNEKLNRQAFEYERNDEAARGGIAVTNVNNRIRLLFGEEYGIVVYSTLGQGTDVEITLPLLTKDIESPAG